MIDSDQVLAKSCRYRSLIVKGWRSLLISRMQSIHKTHCNKLSEAYISRKLLFKYLQLIKLYVKRILPVER